MHPEAKLGKNVHVDPFTMIHKNVEIGEGTWIGSNVTIMEGARIGKHCKIFPGAVISAIPQDLKFKGEETHVHIGDHTTIRECVTINRGTAALGVTKIGSHCLIMAYSHIAHDCKVGDYCVFSNNSTLAGHINVGNKVILSGFTAIHQFCTIGDYAFVAGGSMVRKDVPPFIKVGREPLAFIGINSVGLNRNGFLDEQIKRIQEAYRTVFQSNLNSSQALDVLEQEETNSDEKFKIIEFLKKSERGIVKGYS
ncbi:acyl-ACP--UDP-N-acetylglucosamine O-acyltransferase [Flavobacteriaceae bacterium]|nr:acyl-ACP--UDP-N-acetylglucosamine O-acyltransferase [Flavobacteriaceae bacterium]